MMRDRRGLSSATVLTGTSLGKYRTINSAQNTHQQNDALNGNRSHSAHVEHYSSIEQETDQFKRTNVITDTDSYRGNIRPHSAGMSSNASKESPRDGTVLSEGAKEICKMYEEKIETGSWPDSENKLLTENKTDVKKLTFATCTENGQNSRNTKSAQIRGVQNRRGTNARVTIVDARPYKIRPNVIKMNQKEMDLLSYNTLQEYKRARYAWLPKLCEKQQSEGDHPLRMFSKHKVHVLAELFRTSKKGGK